MLERNGTDLHMNNYEAKLLGGKKAKRVSYLLSNQTAGYPMPVRLAEAIMLVLRRKMEHPEKA